MQGKAKTDWNDIHLSKGIAEIQKQLMRKDIGAISSIVDKPIELPKTIADFVQIKSMKLSGSQIISIRDNAATIDNKRDLNQLVAAYNKSQQALEKSGSFTPEKTLPTKTRSEIEMDR